MRPLAAALAAVTLVRLVVAAMVPLAPDETYYWIWSHALATGYLDHPPMVALWIRAGTLLLGQSALGVRLLGPLAAALASWMLFDAANVLFPGRKPGLVAAMLLNASLLLGVGTVIITPDSPLLFFWTAAFWAVTRVAVGGSGVWWLAAGLAGGLALDSKYTALFLWVGVGLWVLLVPAVRPWLSRWQPWAACVDRAGIVRAGAVLERRARLGRFRQTKWPRRRLAPGSGDRLSRRTGWRPNRPSYAIGLGAVHGRPGGRDTANLGAPRSAAGRCLSHCRCRRLWCSSSTQPATGCKATGRRSFIPP